MSSINNAFIDETKMNQTSSLQDNVSSIKSENNHEIGAVDQELNLQESAKPANQIEENRISITEFNVGKTTGYEALSSNDRGDVMACFEPHNQTHASSPSDVHSDLQNPNNLSASADQSDACDLQREGDTKSPEMILDEVQDEVTKLNISGEQSKIQSKVIVNKETESLKNLMAYDWDSESESDQEVGTKQSGEIEAKGNWRKPKEQTSGTSDSETDSSASSLSSDSDSDSENEEFVNSDVEPVSVITAVDDGIGETAVFGQNNDTGAVKKAKNTSIVYDEYLPPIPDLSNLNIDTKDEFVHMGKVAAVIVDLITIEAVPGIPTFDLDSMLFIDYQTAKKAIGPIFDVLGQVTEPIYCVRFNNEEEIKNLDIKPGMKVYAAPKREEFSKFVFVQELLKMKGSDASWLNDHELPADMAELSDDDQERNSSRGGKLNGKRKLDDNSLERHRRYEKTMNQCNTLNTRVCKLMDSHKNLSRQIRAPPTLPDVPAEFNPTVPPPGFGHPSPYGYPAQPNVFASSSSGFGAAPNFGASPSYNPSSVNQGAQAVFVDPSQFGSFYASQAPAPRSWGAPPARCDFRRGRPHPRSGQRQNSDNYFTNNSRNFTGPGPSSQPF